MRLSCKIAQLGDDMRTSRKGIELIKATEATYDQFVSGLIRSRYSADQVEAILLNIQSNDPDRMAEFQQELDTLNAYRDECKLIASELLE